MDDVGLDDVADSDIVGAVEHDPALESGVHLAGVVLHSAERSDVPVEDRGTSTLESCLSGTPHRPVDHEAAGDDGLVRGEDLPDLGMPAPAKPPPAVQKSGSSIVTARKPRPRT